MSRKALRRPRKTDIEGAEVTCWDRLFQVCAAATGKAWSYAADSEMYECVVCRFVSGVETASVTVDNVFQRVSTTTVHVMDIQRKY